jgi:hypothetical protein
MTRHGSIDIIFSPIELAAIAWARARVHHWEMTRPIYKRTGQPTKEEQRAIDASLERMERLREALLDLALSASPPPPPDTPPPPAVPDGPGG